MYISGVLPCKFHNSAFKSKLDKPGFSMPHRQAKAEKNHMKSDPIS